MISGFFFFRINFLSDLLYKIEGDCNFPVNFFAINFWRDFFHKIEVDGKFYGELSFSGPINL